MNLNLLILLFPDGALLDCSFLAETAFVVLEWVGFFFLPLQLYQSSLRCGLSGNGKSCLTWVFSIVVVYYKFHL